MCYTSMCAAAAVTNTSQVCCCGHKYQSGLLIAHLRAVLCIDLDGFVVIMFYLFMNLIVHIII